MEDKFQVQGKARLYDLWGDGMVFRNLKPPDNRLPSFDHLRQQLRLEGAPLPRKVEVNYARVVVEILKQARRLEIPSGRLKRLIYLGDTRLLDATAFQNLCQAGEWDGWAFIGQDKLSEPKAIQVEGKLFLANRWSALNDFARRLSEEGFGLDETTALVIDMDKTAVGARGRNDKPIDEARLEGVRRTVADLLGNDFDEATFREVYAHLNQPQYHAFTADNQDYLAYICLMLGTPLYRFEALLEDIHTGTLQSFFGFIQQIEARKFELPAKLRSIHAAVWENVQMGDPTPFKAFRYNEYLTTAQRFTGDEEQPIPELLMQRIVITGEVMQFAQQLRRNGALLFGLSDKPDEASLPGEDQARQGMQPLHRLGTLVISRSDDA